LNKNEIAERILKNKYEELFKDLNYDLHRVLVLHKYDEKISLNNLKLKLATTMDDYKNKMYKVSRGKNLEKEKRF